MAQTRKSSAQSKKTNKGNTKAKGGRQNGAEIVPDFWREYPLGETDATVELSLYDRENKDDRVKLVIAGTFIIYCTAKVMEDYAFLSYPSFKAGDKFINHAFCIDKSINKMINDDLTGYYFE